MKYIYIDTHFDNDQGKQIKQVSVWENGKVKKSHKVKILGPCQVISLDDPLDESGHPLNGKFAWIETESLVEFE